MIRVIIKGDGAVQRVSNAVNANERVVYIGNNVVRHSSVTKWPGRAITVH